MLPKVAPTEAARSSKVPVKVKGTVTHAEASGSIATASPPESQEPCPGKGDAAARDPTASTGNGDAAALDSTGLTGNGDEAANDSSASTNLKPQRKAILDVVPNELLVKILAQVSPLDCFTKIPALSRRFRNLTATLDVVVCLDVDVTPSTRFHTFGPHRNPFSMMVKAKPLARFFPLPLSNPFHYPKKAEKVTRIHNVGFVGQVHVNGGALGPSLLARLTKFVSRDLLRTTDEVEAGPLQPIRRHVAVTVQNLRISEQIDAHDQYFPEAVLQAVHALEPRSLEFGFWSDPFLLQEIQEQSAQKLRGLKINLHGDNPPFDILQRFRNLIALDVGPSTHDFPSPVLHLKSLASVLPKFGHLKSLTLEFEMPEDTPVEEGGISPAELLATISTLTHLTDIRAGFLTRDRLPVVGGWLQTFPFLVSLGKVQDPSDAFWQGLPCVGSARDLPLQTLKVAFEDSVKLSSLAQHLTSRLPALSTLHLELPALRKWDSTAHLQSEVRVLLATMRVRLPHLRTVDIASKDEDFYVRGNMRAFWDGAIRDFGFLSLSRLPDGPDYIEVEGDLQYHGCEVSVDEYMSDDSEVYSDEDDEDFEGVA